MLLLLLCIVPLCCGQLLLSRSSALEPLSLLGPKLSFAIALCLFRYVSFSFRFFVLLLLLLLVA